MQKIIFSILIAVVLLTIIGIIIFGMLVCPGEQEVKYMLGYLQVLFRKDLTYQEAQTMIESYGLKVEKSDAMLPEEKTMSQFMFDEFHALTVYEMPKGKEKEWQQRLLDDNRIENVEFVRTTPEPQITSSQGENVFCKFINFFRGK